MGNRARGQTLVQLALALPVFLFVLVGTFQFLLTLHVQSVALAAAENGAALAAARDAGPEVGRARARELLRVGLGRLAQQAEIEASDADGIVLVEVTLRLQPLTPLTDQLGLTTVHARGRATREIFRPGGGTLP